MMMATILQFFRDSFRHDFFAVMFFLVAGVIALVFIGYLMIDLIKGINASVQRKKKHRHEHHLP